jgi:uncharacterized protein involved in response to NO
LSTIAVHADRPITLLAMGFRPFFLLAGTYGALTIAAWLAFIVFGVPVPVGPAASLWHSHELLFGVVPAAIAGFLLTAVSNWTGAPPLHGRALAALIALWLAGRAAMWLQGVLPAPVVALLDLAFLPVLGAYLASVVIRHRNWRNLVVVGVVLLLAAANTMVHAGIAGFGDHWARAGELLALNLIVLLMVIIAGRITPAFTVNWLRKTGRDGSSVRVMPGLERLVVPITALMIPADLVGSPGMSAGVALVAALLHGVRLVQWRGWHTVSEPLLWILHVAYLWIVVALVLKALAPVDAIAASAWIHALGAGAIGTLIVGVMTRVAAGHTGRPLQLVRHAVWLYVAITAGAIARVLTALGLLAAGTGLALAAVGWVVAFAGFAVLYWPVLSRARVDGRAG